MGVTFKSSEVDGSARCKTKIKHKNIFAKKGTTRDWKYDRARIVKNLVAKALEKKSKEGIVLDRSILYDKLLDSFNELSFETKQTAQAQSKTYADAIYRYISCEKKKLIGYDLPVKYFELPNEDMDNISVKPDFIFEEEGIHGKILHAVKLGLSTKPAKFNKDLESKLFVWYVQEFINENNIKDVSMIEASYYYLRKKDDNKDFRVSFWGDNVVTPIRYSDTVMQNLKPIDLTSEIDEFLDGVDEDDCTKEACEYCDLYDVCKAKKIPVATDEVSETSKELIKTLSKKQQEAIYINKGIWRVNAVAGAGKTTVICLRAANLLYQGVDPKDIILLTFTEKAAEEMKERVKAYAKGFKLDIDISKIHCQTFHSYGNDIIIDNYEELGYKTKPRLIDTIEQKRIVATLLEQENIRGLDYKNFKMDLPNAKGALMTTLKIIELIKSKSLTINDVDTILKDDICKRIEGDKEECIKEIIHLTSRYNNVLKTLGLIDYVDQESVLLKLAKENPYVFEDLGFKHVIIDEFQDINDIQFAIIKGLANNACNESLMVVGDDLQSIYAFRGAIPEYIVNFYDYLGLDGTDIDLSTNYRSSNDVIDFANNIIDVINNKVDKKLVSHRGYEEPVKIKRFDKKSEEPIWIANQVEELIKKGTKKEDIAIIAFKGTELQKIGDELSTKGIEWNMYNPEKYLDNSKVLGAVSLARLVQDENDTSAALCYLNAKANNDLLKLFNDKHINEEMDKLCKKVKRIAEDKSVEKFLNLLKDLGLEDEIYESFYQKLENQKSSFETLINYMNDFETYGENEKKKREKKYPGVILTTAHSSKGLEFPIVFNTVTSYSKKGSFGRQEISDEEWRLFFTSATRAKDKLVITSKRMKTKKEVYYFADKIAAMQNVVEIA